MSHKHWCDVAGHEWECDGTAVRRFTDQPTICMCFDHGVPMEHGDHSACTIELLPCSAHKDALTTIPDVASQPMEDYVNEGSVPIQFPVNLEEMLDAWIESSEPNIGWCLMCNSPIRSQEELFPGTGIHDCDGGRALEAKIANKK